MKGDTSSDLHPTPPKTSNDGTKASETGNKSPRSARLLFESHDTITIDKVSVGNVFDIQDSSSRWCEGQIVKIDREGGTVFVKYLYWDSRYDEWVPVSRLAPLHFHTYVENGQLKVGQRVEVLDEIKVWREAFVMDETDTQVLIHYKGFHNKFDEWIPRHNAELRIRQYGPHKIQHKVAGGELAHGLAQKQWRVPGSHVMRANIPGRRSAENKDRMKIKLPCSASSTGTNGTTLPAIANTKVGGVTDVDVENDDSRGGNDNQLTHEDDARTRRITALSERYAQYTHALSEQGLHIEAVEGDGNCLFRAVAHQIYGDENLHNLVRQKCLDYMESESEFFSQFVEGGRDMFPFYLRAKRMDACWGDDPEIEAICELYNRRAEIWAFDTAHGARKLRTFHESSVPQAHLTVTQSHAQTHAVHLAHQHSTGRGHTPGSSHRPSSGSSSSAESRTGGSDQHGVIRLSYYGGGHYDSIVNHHHNLDLIRKVPGEVEDTNIARAAHRRALARNSSAAGTVEQLSDREATEQATLDLVLQESRNAYINQGYDDLESCLMLSLQTAPGHLSPRYGGLSRDNSYHGRLPPLLKEGSDSLGHGASSRSAGPSSSAGGNPAGTTFGPAGAGRVLDAEADLIATQGDILRTVQEQSERDFVDRAILLSSLSDTGASSAGPHSNKGDGGAEHDPYTQRALELSNLSEQEALELALRESMQPHTSHALPIRSSASSSSASGGHGHAGSSTSSALNGHQDTGNEDFQTEEELLQMALQASMEGYHAPIPAASSGVSSAPSYTINIGAPYAAAGAHSDYMEDMDEELMRAVEASLRK